MTEFKDQLKSLLGAEARSASVYVGMSFIQQAGRFLIVPLFWRRLTPEDYGLLAVTEAIGLFVSMFLGLQLEQSITRYYHEWAEPERRNMLGNLWITSWISSILIGPIAAVLVWLARPFLFPNVEFFPFIFLGLVNTVLTSLSVITFSTLRIRQLTRAYAIFNLGTFFLQLSLNVVFVIPMNMGVYGLLLSYAIGAGINACASLAVMRWQAKPTFDPKALGPYLKFSLPYIPSFALASMSQIVIRVLLQRFVSLEALGIYSLSARFAGLVVFLHAALKIAYVPFISKAASTDGKDGKKLIARVAVFYYLPTSIFALAVGMFTKYFVLIIDQEKYFPIIRWVPFLVVPSLIATFTVLFTPGLFLAKRSDRLWISHAAQLTAVTIAGLLLIPSLDLPGVVSVRYIGAIVFFLVMLYFSEKFYRIPFEWWRIAAITTLVPLTLSIAAFVSFEWIWLDLFVGVSLFLLSTSAILFVGVGLSGVRALASSRGVRD